jgi:hypothetical protein
MIILRNGPLGGQENRAHMDEIKALIRGLKEIVTVATKPRFSNQSLPSLIMDFPLEL